MVDQEHGNSVRLLKPADVAARLQVSVGVLEKWRRCGVGPAFVRLGRHRGAQIRYRESEIERFLDEHSDSGSPDTD